MIKPFGSINFKIIYLPNKEYGLRVILFLQSRLEGMAKGDFLIFRYMAGCKDKNIYLFSL